ncbi:MAG: hypothetical protein IIT98_06305 [Kiritimatiellae bacterium]|nr:hypothetical protein [Kiritimatiellia bacterium]
MTARHARAPLAAALLAAFAAFPAAGGAAGAGPARLFPYNASFWELVDEKGAVHDLPVAPLTGAISDGRWFVAPGRHGNAEATLGGKKYVFKNGFLAAIEESGKKRTFEVPPAMPSGGVEALFPAEKSAAGEAQDGGGVRFSTKIWETSDRFNAFYGNPNKTAVLFVQLALVLLAAAVALPRRGSVLRIAGAAVCAAGAAGCAVCMFMTCRAAVSWRSLPASRYWRRGF